MKTIFLGKNCIEVAKTDSTNSYLARLNSEKALFDGTVVVAWHQEQGRGQRGSSWESEPGKNLTLSIFLKPTFLKPEEQFMLSKAVALALIEFVASPLAPLSSRRGDGGEARIKWPNDIYIGNKKIAGILIENVLSGNSIAHSIVGIGININQVKFSADLPNPTSLKLETGKEFDLKECLAQLCSCIEKRYLQLRPHPPTPPSERFIRAGSPKREGGIDSDYLKNLYRFGELASYQYKGKTIKAKIFGITQVGKLLLETEKGESLECDFKEIMFL